MFGIISDAEFEAQINELNEPPSRERSKIVDIERGRGNRKEVPTEIRKIIGEEKINGASNKELSQLFGVSESSVSAYGNDATSTATYHHPNELLKESNDAIREKITSSARSRLMMALENVTEEKLTGAKVRDVASVAKDMSAIIKNMEPDHGNNGSRLNQQFIFMTPKTKSEDDFEMIEARE